MIKWVLLLAAAAVVWGFGLAAPAAAHASAQPAAATVYTMTPERIAASTAALVGLIGAVIGGLALARSAGRIGNGNGRRGAIVALVLAPIGLVIGGLVVATADGGVGTGHGLARTIHEGPNSPPLRASTPARFSGLRSGLARATS